MSSTPTSISLSTYAILAGAAYNAIKGKGNTIPDGNLPLGWEKLPDYSQSDRSTSGPTSGFGHTKIDQIYKPFGLLTHIDKSGQVLSKKELSPKGGGNFAQAEFVKCVATPTGVVLFGLTSPVGNPEPGHEWSSWIVKLDNNGEIVSEQLPGKFVGRITSLGY